MSKRLLMLFVLFFSLLANGQTVRYWIATSSSNWNNANNWSTVLNGTPQGGIPKQGEIVVFDGSDKGNCSVDISINLNKLETRNGYVGTILLNAGTAVIGSGGLIHGAGTFDCNRAAVSISGDLAVSSSFIATSETLNLGSNLTLGSSNQFDPVDGTVFFSKVATTTISNTPQFYNVIFKAIGAGTNVITATQGFSVYRDMSLESSSLDVKIDGGIVSVGGDLKVSNSWKLGTATINFNGLGNQQLTSTGNNVVEFTNLQIDKIDGDVLSKGSLSITSEIHLKQGNLLISNSAALRLESTSVLVESGPNSFVDGTIYKSGSNDFVFPVGSGEFYAPVKISNLSATQDISCKYYSSTTPNRDSLISPVIAIDDCAYWSIIGSPGSTAKITFYPLIYTSCLNLNSVSDYLILANANDAWSSLTATNLTDGKITNSITPNGLFTVGSTGALICPEAPLYWVGAVSTSWSDPLNWSKTSGGPGGYGVPCKISTVIFDGNGNIDCDLSNNVEVAMALFRPDYTAEITTNGFQLRIKELFK